MNLSLEGMGRPLCVAKTLYGIIVSLVAGWSCDKSLKIKPEDKIIAVAQEGEEFVDVALAFRLRLLNSSKVPKGSIVKLQSAEGSK